MNVQVGDIYTIDIDGRHNYGHVYIIVRPKRGSYKAGWETYNLTIGQYEWDYDSALLNPYIYRKLA